VALGIYVWHVETSRHSTGKKKLYTNLMGEADVTSERPVLPEMGFLQLFDWKGNEEVY